MHRDGLLQGVGILRFDSGKFAGSLYLSLSQGGREGYLLFFSSTNMYLMTNTVASATYTCPARMAIRPAVKCARGRPSAAMARCPSLLSRPTSCRTCRRGVSAPDSTITSQSQWTLSTSAGRYQSSSEHAAREKKKKGGGERNPRSGSLPPLSNPPSFPPLFVFTSLLFFCPCTYVVRGDSSGPRENNNNEKEKGYQEDGRIGCARRLEMGLRKGMI